MLSPFQFLMGISLIICCTTSCTKEPSACFDVIAPDTIKVYTPIKFNSCAIDGHDYYWDFGDGKTTKSENASHTYEFPGSYTVEQTVVSKNGKAVTTHSEIINVQHHPQMVINQVSLTRFPEEFESSSILMVFETNDGLIHDKDTIHYGAKPNTAYPFEQGFPITLNHEIEEYGNARIAFYQENSFGGITFMTSFEYLPFKYIYYNALTPEGVKPVSWNNEDGFEVLFNVVMK